MSPACLVLAGGFFATEPPGCHWACSPMYSQQLVWWLWQFGALQNINCFNTFVKNQYKYNNFWRGPWHLKLKTDLWDDGLNIVPRNSLTSPLCQHYIRDHIKCDWLKLKNQQLVLFVLLCGSNSKMALLSCQYLFYILASIASSDHSVLLI